MADRFDRFVDELSARGLPPEEIRKEAAAMLVRLKAEQPARPARPSLAAVTGPDETATVVLKSSGDKERLTRRLSQILRRSLTATRMAVDMTPGIILYKSRPADVKEVTAILADEQLHFTVLAGDQPTEPPQDKTVPGLAGLSAADQELYRSVPAAMWLGEEIAFFIPAVEKGDEKGLLTVTDQALYFLTTSPGDGMADWDVIPFARLTETVSHRDRDTLQLIYRGYAREENLHITEPSQLERLALHLNKALAENAAR